MSKRARRLVGLAVTLATLTVSGSAAAFCRLTTEGGDEFSSELGTVVCVEEGEPFEWRNTCLSYAIDARGSSWMDFGEVEEAVDLAFETWENANCAGGTPNLAFRPVGPSTCKRAEYNCEGNVNTIAFLGGPDTPGESWQDPCAAPEGPAYEPSAFAVTIVWHDTVTGEIFDADMMINDQLATSTTAGGPYANCAETGCTGDDADLRSIITHEAGHFIGIGHCNPEKPLDPDPNDPCVVATMFKETDRESVDKRTLAPDDIDAVCTIYPPDDLASSACDPIPRGGLQLNCERDTNGDPIACSPTACTPSGGGCSAGPARSSSSWVLVAGLICVLLVRRAASQL